ncbi:unnamed protein product [Zymoseptoria tritici ST99CH_3D7]|uniref:Uncharacterized protein n=1 Tax=Zymoseptoria tritici (strain ST99CH_3D7) TaxID=1276538 RepID=A0A1X7RFX4_ZYMT9|nr:unnamed protein product [Zymoseptoria tritici ST99CH_3D7]
MSRRWALAPHTTVNSTAFPPIVRRQDRPIDSSNSVNAQITVVVTTSTAESSFIHSVSLESHTALCSCQCEPLYSGPSFPPSSLAELKNAAVPLPLMDSWQSLRTGSGSDVPPGPKLLPVDHSSLIMLGQQSSCSR